MIRRTYAKVYPTFWSGRTGRELRLAGPVVQVIAIYLLSNCHAAQIGLYYLPLALLTHETGVEGAAAVAALKTLERIGFARYDHTSETVFVPSMAKFQVLDGFDAFRSGDTRLVAVRKAYAEAPESPFLGAFFDLYGASMGLPARRGGALDGGSMPPPCPIDAPSSQIQLQGQMQEQVQEQEHSAPAGAAAEVADPLLDAIRSSGIPAWRSDRALTLAWATAQRRAFPDLDLVAETHKAASWWLSRPAKTRQRSAVARFLGSTWFPRANEDRGGSRGRAGADALTAAGEAIDRITRRETGGAA